MSQNKRAQEAFEHWYGGRRSCRETSLHVGVSERQVERWVVQYGWRERADQWDAEAERQAERAAVKRRAQVLEEQRKAGELMRRRAVEYFVAHPIETAADAIRAGKVGIELERQAEGLPDWLVQILGMSDDELRAEYDRLLRRAVREHQRAEWEAADDLPTNGASKPPFDS